MLDVTAAAWAATIGLIAALLAVDLFISGRRPHAVGFREAVAWSVFYIAVALASASSFGAIAGWELRRPVLRRLRRREEPVGRQPVRVRGHHEHVRGAGRAPAEGADDRHPRSRWSCAAIFIALGAALLAAFSFMFLIFGLLLIATAIQLFRHRDAGPVRRRQRAGRARAGGCCPFTDRYDGGRLVTRVDGRRVLTPLFLVLLAIGSTDILFALDSIPASSASPTRRSSSSPPTRSRCSACGRCTSSSPGCSTGSSTSPPACRSSSRSSASS